MSVKIFGNGKIEGVAVDKKRIEAFTGSGTFTVPAGVNFAIAHMLGGGGGAGLSSSGDGAASSVAFASGTVSAAGGKHLDVAGLPFGQDSREGAANSGTGAAFHGTASNNTMANTAVGGAGANIVAGAAVTPAGSITVTVGAGGSAGTSGAAGGSGYVYIEYFEEV